MTPAVNRLFGAQEEVVLPTSNMMKDYKKNKNELLQEVAMTE